MTKSEPCSFFTTEILKRKADFRIPFRAGMTGIDKDGIKVRIPFLTLRKCHVPQKMLVEAATDGLKLSDLNDQALKGKSVFVCISAVNKDESLSLELGGM